MDTIIEVARLVVLVFGTLALPYYAGWLAAKRKWGPAQSASRVRVLLAFVGYVAFFGITNLFIHTEEEQQDVLKLDILTSARRVDLNVPPPKSPPEMGGTNEGALSGVPKELELKAHKDFSSSIKLERLCSCDDLEKEGKKSE